MERPSSEPSSAGGSGGGRHCDNLTEIWRREVGESLPVAFVRRVGGSEVFIKRLDLYGELIGHKGCVNTASFSPTGDLLVSGSNDREVILWNWATKSKKTAYPSGHFDNVYQARIMPFTDDRTVITSAADGQVRLGEIKENGHIDTKRLGMHRGRVHKLAIEPGSSHIFYSCGEDGFVQHFDLRNRSSSKLFCCSSFSQNKQPVGLNSIVIDPQNPNYFSAGGFDEYARVYDIRKCQLEASSDTDQPVNTFCPRHLIGSNDINITGLAYSNTSELLISYICEFIYLFQKDMGIGPNPQSASAEQLQKSEEAQVYSGHRNSQMVKGVSFFGPSDDYVASGSDCGHVYIWSKKGGLLRMMQGDEHVVNCIEPHPHFPFLATSGFDEDVKLWIPKAKKLAPMPKNAEKILAANERARGYRVITSPDAILSILNLQGSNALYRHALDYVERRRPNAEVESDGDNTQGATLFVGFRTIDGDDADSDEETTGDPLECNIN